MTSQAESVVLIHGWAVTGVEMGLLRHRLRRAGFEPFQFRYRSMVEGKEKSLERLAQFVAQVPGERIHFVAHSTGAVLMERFLRRTTDQRPGRVVATGPPFRGCWSGSRILGNALGRRWAGPLIREILLDDTTREWDLPRPLAIVAGNMPVGVGRLLGKFPGPNDGVVLLDETRLPGAANHTVFNLSHTGLLFSSVVSRHIIEFLREKI